VLSSRRSNVQQCLHLQGQVFSCTAWKDEGITLHRSIGNYTANRTTIQQTAQLYSKRHNYTANGTTIQQTAQRYILQKLHLHLPGMREGQRPENPLTERLTCGWDSKAQPPALNSITAINSDFRSLYFLTLQAVYFYSVSCFSLDITLHICLLRTIQILVLSITKMKPANNKTRTAALTERGLN
jgi:hypothetical protein